MSKGAVRGADWGIPTGVAEAVCSRKARRNPSGRLRRPPPFDKGGFCYTKELIMENNAILSALSARKSVRVFTHDPVTPDERAAILLSLIHI